MQIEVSIILILLLLAFLALIILSVNKPFILPQSTTEPFIMYPSTQSTTESSEKFIMYPSTQSTTESLEKFIMYPADPAREAYDAELERKRFACSALHEQDSEDYITCIDKASGLLGYIPGDPHDTDYP